MRGALPRRRVHWAPLPTPAEQCLAEMLQTLHSALVLLVFGPLALTLRITSLIERLAAWGAGVWLGLLQARDPRHFTACKVAAARSLPPAAACRRHPRLPLLCPPVSLARRAAPMRLPRCCTCCSAEAGCGSSSGGQVRRVFATCIRL